jgi:tRNA pseudouridine55 synthase
MRGPWCGVLNLNKPSGLTSRAVVDRVARPLRGTRVGHAGTLDPLASGVLVVCVGRATRLIEYVQRMPKTYRTTVRLGARSDTHDADGHIVPVAGTRVPEEAEVRAALTSQVGTIAQRPPEYSAIKLEGRRAYDLARAGESVALPPRPVTIYRIDLISYDWPRLELEVECGGGTYIRSIARDLGEGLGCGALVEVLVRTRIGHFAIEDALDPLTLSPETIPARLRPALDAVPTLPRLTLSPEQVAAVAQGRPVAPEGLGVATTPGAEVALVDPDGALVAVGEADPGAGRILPRRVLMTAIRK